MSTAVEPRQLAPERVEITKTVAFDTWALGTRYRNHGVHVYAGNLLAQFQRLGPQHGIEIRPYTCAGADNYANGFGAAPGFQPRKTRLLKFDRLWRYGGACALASLQRADLVFSPHCTSLYAGSLAPAVVTIHDLIPVRMPWGSKKVTSILQFCSWWAAKFARMIITDSFHSKLDLVGAYNIRESKVAVVYLAHDKKVFNTAPADPGLCRVLLQKLGIRRPYVLHHGVIKPNKNLKSLIEAYRVALGRNRNLEFDLVLAGPPGWEYEEVLAKANRTPGVILTGALSDQEFGVLVKGAYLAVFPSLYEGFCLPMLEAMACGVPTIASNASCLPEISGGVLRYFNPESVEEMAACMEEALEDGDLRAKLCEKGIARAACFDWRRCAQETLAVLRQQLAS